MKTTTTMKKTKKPTQSGLSKTVAKGYKPHGVGEIKQEKKKRIFITMDTFIKLTTTKGEILVLNKEKIVYFCEGKDCSVMYIDEFIRYSVQESLDEILKLIQDTKKGGKRQ